MLVLSSLATVALAGSAMAATAAVQKRVLFESRAAASIPNGWRTLAACAQDDGGTMWKSEEALSLQRNLFPTSNTPTSCMLLCQKNSYGFATLRLGTECWCASQTPKIKKVSEDLCFQNCSGDRNSTCGGNAQSQVYVNLSLAGRKPASEKTARIASGWSVAFNCIEDPTVGQVFLNGDKVTELQTNTPYTCTTLCAKGGYDLAGVEYGNECICGRGYKSQYPPTNAKPGQCFMACSGDKTLSCGAGHRIQMYKHKAFKRWNSTLEFEVKSYDDPNADPE